MQTSFSFAPRILGVTGLSGAATDGLDADDMDGTSQQTTVAPGAWQAFETIGGVLTFPVVRVADRNTGMATVDMFLWLPPRTRIGAGRIVVAAKGTQSGVPGVQTAHNLTYRAYLLQMPGFNQATGHFDNATGVNTTISPVVNDAHIWGGIGHDWETCKLTNIDIDAGADASYVPGHFSQLALRVTSPASSSSLYRGLIIRGLAVENW